MKTTLLFIIGLFAATVSMAQAIDVRDQKVNTLRSSDQDELPGYSGPCGCSGVMPTGEFEQMVSDIRSRNQDVRMLTYAKQIIKGKCLLATQIKAITLLFTYDDTRSNFVKFAAKYNYDRGNYGKVLCQYLAPTINTAFGQAYTRNELNRIWVNQSYSIETARRLYYLGY